MDNSSNINAIINLSSEQLLKCPAATNIFNANHFIKKLLIIWVIERILTLTGSKHNSSEGDFLC